MEAADVSDISNSPAYQSLDMLVASGRLTQAQAQLYRSKYAKLHEVVLKTYENEKNLLKKAKLLNQDLTAEKGGLERAAARARDDSESISQLRAEMSKGEGELSLREERELLLQQEVQDLSSTRSELEDEVSTSQRRQAAELQPQIDVLEAAVDEARGELARHQAALRKLDAERDEAAQRAQQLRAAKTDVEVQKAQLTAQLVKVKTDPEKMKKVADVLGAAHSSLETEAERLSVHLGLLDTELGTHAKARKQLDEEKMQLAMAVERHRAQIEQKERVAEEFRKNLSHSLEEAAQTLAERVRLELEVKAAEQEVRRQQEAVNRRAKEYAAALKRAKRAEASLQTARNLLPFLRRQFEEGQRQVVGLTEEQKKQLAAMEELRREVDVFINSFLKQENVEADKAQWLRQMLEDVKGLGEELVLATAEEREQRKAIAQLNGEREAKARQAAKAIAAARETHEELKVKELVLLDLSKKHAETAVRLREFSKLYDVVKSDRNKYVNQIQASAQALAEMKEKLKILQNEVEILRSESASKDKALSKEHLEHGNGYYARDALRAETNKSLAAVREQEVRVLQLVTEIDNLNALINGIEKEMLKLKQRYEVAVEERNYTGIQLIDRNDELCILYEKCNMQQATLRSGELEIARREEEIRLLDLQVAELVRRVEVTRRKLPQIPALEQQIVTLQSQLDEERALSDRQSAELEAPGNSKRWRKLEGRDPEPEDLAAKLQVLEERVNDKKEQLLEKDLVLEEVSNLANRLSSQALEGRGETLELAKQVNDFQCRIKTTTRRMMATVSELSMYQASAMKLAEENQGRDEALRAQQANMEDNLPPSEGVAQEWLRFESGLDRRVAELTSRNVLAQTAPPQLTQTTAEPRPNAYIPDDIGIPKPYGGMQPFKPSELGTTMRHTRKPQPREIEL